MKKLIFFLAFVFFFLKPALAYAEVIHSFDVNITAHKNGSMDIEEIINYDFEGSERHGIYRYIPLYTKVGNLYRIIKISNVNILRDGQSENFTTSKNNEQVSFKIGNVNKTITGHHIYKISYTVENGIGSNFPDHDEIYWNATGNGWDVSIEKASTSITNDFGAKTENFICFTGSFGSTEKNCQIKTNSASASNILPGQGLTAVAVYLPNTFPKSVLSKNPPQTFGQMVFSFFLKYYYLLIIFLNFFLAPYLIYWYEKHKNKNRFGPPSVNFDIPKDDKGERLGPAIAGTIDTAKLERDDVAATIFDLAIRKYIKLEDVKKPTKIFGLQLSAGDQLIRKLKEDDGKLNSFEKTLLNRLFKDGKSARVSDFKKDFYKTFQNMEKDVFKLLVGKKYYTKNPKVQKTLLIFAAIISFVSFNIVLGVVLFFLSKKLNGRTALGDEKDYKIDGLKLFLKSMDRNYKWQAEQLYIVEQMIPYAMALGYIDKFMKQLKIIKPDYNPTWYSGYSGSFYASYAGFYSSMTTSITTSSSSGTGGGGFSGGGSGGGGGGSW